MEIGENLGDAAKVLFCVGLYAAAYVSILLLYQLHASSEITILNAGMNFVCILVLGNGSTVPYPLLHCWRIEKNFKLLPTKCESHH